MLDVFLIVCKSSQVIFRNLAGVVMPMEPICQDN